MEHLCRLVFDIYQASEEAFLSDYTIRYDFPERRSQLVLEFWDSMLSGNIDGLEEIDRSDDLAKLLELLSGSIGADKARELIFGFLRNMLSELAEEYGSPFLDMGGFRYSSDIEFRTDLFDSMLPCFIDVCFGHDTLRVEAAVEGLGSQAPFESTILELEEEVYMEVRKVTGSQGQIVLVKKSLYDKSNDADETDRSLVLFRTILSAMRVFWGPHIGFCQVVKRLPLGERDSKFDPSTYREPGLSDISKKIILVDSPELERFAGFWKLTKKSGAWNVVRIALDRFQRHPRSGAMVRHEDRLIDLVVACDALLGEHAAEATRKLSLRFAALMQVVYGMDPAKTWELIDQSYDSRSKIVHGAKTAEQLDLSYPFDLENVVRLGIAAFLCGGIESKKELLSELDELVKERLKGTQQTTEERFPRIHGIQRNLELLPASS